MKLPLLKSAAPLALVVACPALGQETTVAAHEQVEAEEMPCFFPLPVRYDHTITVIGARQPIPTVAASVDFLTTADIARQQDVSIADALTRFPGVAATRNGGPGGFTGLRIRGADAAQTLVIIDGVRVGDPSAPGGGFDFASLLTDGVDRVEILRGSNSIAWGSDAIGGVVIVDTLGGASGTGLNATVEGGSFGTARASAEGRYGTDFITASIGGGYFTTDGISAAANGREADGYRRWSGHGGITFNLSDNLRWQNSVYVSHGRIEQDGFAPPTFAFGDTDEMSEVQEIYGRSALLLETDDANHMLGYVVADINRDNYADATTTTASFLARGRSERLSYQVDWDRDAIRFVAGADYEWSRLLTDDGFSPDAQSTGIGGGYLQAVVQPVDNVRIGGGIRHDEHRRFGGATVASANAVWEPIDRLAARLAYSEGFKAPTLFQLSANPVAFGNPDLKPERSQSYEVGLRYRSFSDWHIDAGLFRRDSSNLIDFVSCSGTGTPAICASGNRFFGSYANIAAARAEGVEVAGDIRLGDVTLAANYSHITSTDRSIGRTNSGRRLARRPIDTALASVDWHASNGIGLGGDIRYVGPSFDDGSNSVRLDGYALVTLRGSVALGDKIELFARVENLADTAYQNVAGYGTPGRSFSIGLRTRL